MKFLVVDDHVLIREALSGILRELRSDCQILEAVDGASALAALQSHGVVDVVLLDLHLPDLDGMQILSTIAERHPETAVVMLSGDEDQAVMREALDLGAQGFIPKSEKREVLSSAMALILAGGIYVPPRALGSSRASGSSVAKHPTLASLGLTNRQLEVLALLMQAKNNKIICRELGIAEPTAKNHVTAILKALGVNTRTEAVLAVTRYGWSLPQVGRRRGSAE
jgi:DNA-binding NarL/FixJ family response regulator